MSQLFLLIILICQNEVNSNVIRGLQTKPLKAPKYGYNPGSSPIIPHHTQMNSDLDNVWEKSGLYEGDIMTYSKAERNGILNLERRWPNATVPFYIEESQFTDDEVKVILSVFKIYHQKTCVRFKPYEESDNNWVIITGNEKGCWSSVGMKEEGQVR